MGGFASLIPAEPLRGPELERVVRSGGIPAAFNRRPAEVVSRRGDPEQFARGEPSFAEPMGDAGDCGGCPRCRAMSMAILSLIEEYLGIGEEQDPYAAGW